MSGRDIGSATDAALQAPHVEYFPLVHMALDSGDVYITGAPFNVDYGGHTYSTLLGLGTIEPIPETDSEQAGLAFVVSAVPDAAIALALTENVADRVCTLRLAVVDAGVLRVDDAVWQGLLDVMVVTEGPNPTVRITAEHMLVSWDEPAGLMYSDADQQQLHPGDKFFEYTAQMSEATLAWPSAAALRAEAGG